MDTNVLNVTDLPEGDYRLLETRRPSDVWEGEFFAFVIPAVNEGETPKKGAKPLAMRWAVKDSPYQCWVAFRVDAGGVVKGLPIG